MNARVVRHGRRVIAEVLETRTMFSSYYVSPAGDDAAAGTHDAPWRTLQKAADSVAAGDYVTVKAGTYDAGFHLTADGTDSARITFYAESGATITGPNATTPDAINLEGADYVTVKGFTIDNTANGSITRAGIRSVTNTDAVIKNNTIHAPGTWGIFTGFSENVYIENNEANRAGEEHGIYVSNSADHPTIRNNRLWGNNGCGIHMNGDVSMGGDGVISGALVENNTIYGNGLGGGSGINGDGLQDSIIRNNLVYDNHASGISLYKIDGGAGSSGNYVMNNTVVVADDGRWALNIADGSKGNTVFNNIFLNLGSYRGSVTISHDSLEGFESDHNVVMDRFTTDDGDSVMTLADWRTATGQDAHSLVATPEQLFMNAAEGDFRLIPAAPAVDAGTSSFNGKSAPSKDMSGDMRPADGKHDIGADEAPGTLPVLTWTQTTAGHFNAGVLTDVVVANNAGGELRLRFGQSSEFTGKALMNGWTVAPAEKSVKPLALESGGFLTVGAAHVASPVVPLMAVTGRARFDAAAAQQFGLATSLSAGAAGHSWAVFSTMGTTDKLYARVNVKGVVKNVPLGARPAGFHDYRVEPRDGGVKFYVDGVLKAYVEMPLPAGASYRVTASARDAARPMKLDHARMSRFATRGTFVSSVFDAGRTATWTEFLKTKSIPSGAGYILETMSGNTAKPDGSWSEWAAVDGGHVQSPAARYIRYRITLKGDGSVTPVFSDVTIAYA